MVIYLLQQAISIKERYFQTVIDLPVRMKNNNKINILSDKLEKQLLLCALMPIEMIFGWLYNHMKTFWGWLCYGCNVSECIKPFNFMYVIIICLYIVDQSAILSILKYPWSLHCIHNTIQWRCIELFLKLNKGPNLKRCNTHLQRIIHNLTLNLMSCWN